jgi:hypothetical protein
MKKVVLVSFIILFLSAIVPNGLATSYHKYWAGYKVTTTSDKLVTGVSGWWRVPSIPSTSERRESSAWVGIGGGGSYPTYKIIQLGTNHNSSNNKVSYWAWYWYAEAGDGCFWINGLNIQAGDVISAFISYGSTGWFLEMDVSRSGSPPQGWNQLFSTHSDQLSAEWIVERPKIDGLSTLANFGSVTFGGCLATVGGKSGSINSFSYDDFIMTSDGTGDGTVLASPSSLSLDGKSFTVYYVTPWVGGIVLSIDKFGLLAPYIGLASTTMAATVAVVIYVKHVERRKERQ